MINISEVLETNKMVLEENLDVRTITMGISLLDCIDASVKTTCDNVYRKLTTLAKDLVKTGDAIGQEIGVPVVRPSKTPDRISTVSLSLRFVVRRLCPGLRRSR